MWSFLTSAVEMLIVIVQYNKYYCVEQVTLLKLITGSQNTNVKCALVYIIFRTLLDPMRKPQFNWGNQRPAAITRSVLNNNN